MKVRTYLLEHGIRPSLHRIAVMEYLFAHRTHPTADTIYSELSASIPTLSKTTVYNIIKLLVEKNAILAIDIDKKQKRYDGYVTPHAHFMCQHCNEIIDFDIDNADLLKHVPEGFKVNDIQLLYKGICNKCNKN